jgi:hypothetical protein
LHFLADGARVVSPPQNPRNRRRRDTRQFGDIGKGDFWSFMQYRLSLSFNDHVLALLSEAMGRLV